MLSVDDDDDDDEKDDDKCDDNDDDDEHIHDLSSSWASWSPNPLRWCCMLIIMIMEKYFDDNDVDIAGSNDDKDKWAC